MPRNKSVCALLVFVVLALFLATAPTVSAAPSLGSRALIKDARGDATGVIVEGPVLPNERTLDVLSGSIKYDRKNQALTFAIVVDDLTSTAPALSDPGTPFGPGGYRIYRFYFTYLGVEYFVGITADDTASGPLYELYRTAGTGTELEHSMHVDRGNVVAPGLDGTYDTIDDRITVALPLLVFNASARPSRGLAPGAKLTSIQILAQPSAGVVLSPAADVATAARDHVVGGR